MATVDGWLEGFLHGPSSLGIILLVSLALGLRHASDPDHLAALTTLIASEEERQQVHKAGFMGLLWGLGHGTTLVVFGLPLMFFNSYLPEPVQRAAETLVGVIIIFLAVRLLLRWRRGLYHAHAHTHDGELAHKHLHSHAEDGSHEHSHRVPFSAYGVGLVHGIGGSGGLTVLLLSTISDQAQAAGALLIFAAGTAISMAILSIAFGLAIAGGPIERNFERVAPVLGLLSMAFGIWYALGASGAVTYPF
jgi:cytochrome c biogenesis protein CcdA